MPHTTSSRASLLLLLLLCCACKTPNTSSAAPAASALCAPAKQDDPSASLATRSAHTPELRHDELIERTLSFSSKQHTFRATLTIPVTAKKNAQLPGVLLLHDWGKPSMLGTSRGSLGVRLPVEVHLYELLASALARQGFAVLRYEKRSCVQDAAPSCTYPRQALEPHLDTLAQALLSDAEQALETLRQQPEVSPARIAIVGHGQGAELAAALTRSASHPPSAIVLLSPSTQPVHRVIAHQIDFSLNASRAQLTRQGDDPLADLLRRQISMLQDEQQAAKELEDALGAEKPAINAAFGLPLATWKSFAALHAQAIAALKRKDLPATLTILGALDADLPESNPQALTDLLRDQSAARQEILGDTTHDMIFVEDPPEEEARARGEEEEEGAASLTPSMHPELAAIIADFLRAALTSAAR